MEQRQLDFSHRGYRRSVIQAYRCPEVTITEGKSRRVMKSRDLKAVLRAIDDFGIVCYASQATIAESIDCPVTHAKRCLRALKTLGLLVDSRRAHGVEYRIAFSELAAENQRRESASDRPTSGSITEEVIDPLIDPLIDPNGQSDRPTSGSTNGLTINNQPSSSEPAGGVTDDPATATKVGVVGTASEWDAAKAAVTAAGCELAARAVAEAKTAGMTAEELTEAAYVVQHTPRLSGGAILGRIRLGGWPVSGVPTADEIRQMRAEQAIERAAALREIVFADVASRSERPPGWVIAAVCARKLTAEGCTDQISPDEHTALQRYEEGQPCQ